MLGKPFFDITMHWRFMGHQSYVLYGNRGCGVSKGGVKNYKGFCIKINIPKGNFWILRIGLMGGPQYLAKIRGLEIDYFDFSCLTLEN